MRSHQGDECAASECTLMCDDYHRLGFSSVVVDPSVQLAYDYYLAREMMASKCPGGGVMMPAHTFWTFVLVVVAQLQYQLPHLANASDCALVCYIHQALLLLLRTCRLA